MIVSRAPLRVSFIGGGTDYPEYFKKHIGCVVGMAINLRVYVNLLPLPPNAEQNFRFTYRKIESVEDYLNIEHPVVRETLRDRNWGAPINLATMADVAGNSGLGSSSAFSVALLNALYRFEGENLDPTKLASEAIRIEREILSETGGWQDQYQAAFGGLRSYRFTENGVAVSENLITETIEAELSQYFYLVPVGFSRLSSSFARNTLTAIDDETKLRYFHDLSEMAIQLSESLQVSNLDTQLALTHLINATNQGWELKLKYSGNSIPTEANELLNSAAKAGAFAGRMCGSGGGGYIFLIADVNSNKSLRNFLHQNHAIPIKIDRVGAEVFEV